MAECSCPTCSGACEHKPGWFLPSDIPKLAKLKGISEEELVRNHLAVDFWIGDLDAGELVFVLAPPNTKVKPGNVYPLEPRGRCAFFTEDRRCSIHAAKPHECRMAFHTDKARKVQERKQAIVRVWRRHQNWLFRLLGGVPELPKPDIDDVSTLMLIR